MTKYVYNATLVSQTIEKLNESCLSLETTEDKIINGINKITSAKGSELIDIDFSPITNYYSQVIDNIDLISAEIASKAQEIEEYQKSPWHKKLFSTIGLSSLKIVEGLGTFLENIGDGVVSIAGFVGGIFNSEFKDSVAEFVKKDHVGDTFNEAYEEGPLQDLSHYSVMSHESTAANVLKGVGVAAGYVAISLATGGSNLAVEIGVEAGLAGITGIGAGTQEGLQAGKTFNQAFGQGVKTGAIAAAGEAVMGVAINKAMKLPEVQEIIGKAATVVSNAKTKVASIFVKNTDDVVKAADNITETTKAISNVTDSSKIINIAKSAEDSIKVGDDVAALKVGTNIVDEIPMGMNADGTYRLTKGNIIQDDISKISSQADNIISASNESTIKIQPDRAYNLTKGNIIQDDLSVITKQSPKTPDIVNIGDDTSAIIHHIPENSPSATLDIKEPNINDYGNVGMYGTKADDTMRYQEALHTARKTTPGSVEQQEAIAKLADTYGNGSGGKTIDPNLKSFNSTEQKAAYYGKQLNNGTLSNANTYVENIAEIAGYGDDFNDFIADEALRYAKDKATYEAAQKLAGNIMSETIENIPAIAPAITGLAGASDNIIRAGLGVSDDIVAAGMKSIDDAVMLGDDIAALKKGTNIDLKTNVSHIDDAVKSVDDIPRGINKDGTYRLTKDEIIQGDLVSTKKTTPKSKSELEIKNAEEISFDSDKKISRIDDELLEEDLDKIIGGRNIISDDIPKQGDILLADGEDVIELAPWNNKSSNIFDSNGRYGLSKNNIIQDGAINNTPRQNAIQNLFRRDNVYKAPETKLTPQQAQAVKYLNKSIKHGEYPIVKFDGTEGISSAMLSQVDDLSKVRVQVLDGLGDGQGMLKTKYQYQRYGERVTYSGYEMRDIIGELERLQSKIDMNLPTTERAKQIADILRSEYDYMCDFNRYANGHQISASLRGLTSNNPTGKKGLVCAGYASTYKELCERAGIKCEYIRGKGILDGTAENHAWNVVITEQGAIPVDVTWHKPGSTKWFGASDEFVKTHQADIDEIYQDYSTASMLPKYVLDSSDVKIKNAVDIMTKKYGSREAAIKQLEGYLENNNYNYITSTNNARDMIKATDRASVSAYVTEYRTFEKLQEIVDTTNVKLQSSNTGYHGLRKYLTTGEATGITRTNGARDSMLAIDKEMIKKFLQSKGWWV